MSQLVEESSADAGQLSYRNDHSEVLVTYSKHTGSNIDSTAIIRKFLLDVVVFKSNSSGNDARSEACVAD